MKGKPHHCCLNMISFLSFLGLHPQCTEVPRLGTESELQLSDYTIAAEGGI